MLTDVPTYLDKVTKIDYNPCTGTVVTHKPVLVSRRWVEKLPPEHRVKPKPLDITKRAKQYTAEATSSLELRHEYVGPLYCPPGTPGKPWYKDFYYYGMLTDPGGLLLSMVYKQPWILALRLKLQDEKVSFAETLGEWREALGLLSSAANTLRKTMKMFAAMRRSRGRMRAAKKWFRSIFGRDANSPLELGDAVSLDLAIKFGIKPNLDLLWDTLQTLGVVRSRSRRLRVTCKCKSTKTIKNGTLGEVRLTGERSYRAVAYVKFAMNDSLFTAGNLAEALWAGTSVSFVVDWFLDVGSYLSSFNGMAGVESFICALTIKDELHGLDYRVNSQYGVILKPGSFEAISHERQVITTLPFADLPTFKLPDSELFGRLGTLTEMLYSMRRSR